MKNSSHFSTPDPAIPSTTGTKKPGIEDRMNLKIRFQAALIWISERLPCAQPQFQLTYSSGVTPKEEE